MREKGLSLDMSHQFLTVNEVAALVRRTPRTIYRWIERGLLPAHRIRSGWLIASESVRKLLPDS